MCEQDPDVLKWGLNFLDVDQMFSSSYYVDTNNTDIHISEEQYLRDSQHDIEFNNVENDEIIAHTLQEELSRLSVAETESSQVVEQQFQASKNIDDWYHPSTRNHYYDETDDVGHSSSCSSPGDRSCDGDDFYSLELADHEPELDGEYGKRLNEMIPVPHVPKINGDIPSVDEATSDHQRLQDRLKLYDLVECRVQGDGNCQFRALSDQFYRTTEHHKFVRRQVVNQLKSHPELYEGYVPMAYGDYLKKMSRSGEWGDHVTLQAAADSYSIKIFVITSFKDTCSIEILPKVEKSNRIIFLSFWAEVHYNSIYPEGELPLYDAKRKKRWWIFGNKS
jgi:hypothetical protein